MMTIWKVLLQTRGISTYKKLFPIPFKREKKLTVSDKIDRIVTNRFLGLPIFVFVMWVVYYVSVTTVGTGMTDWTNDVFVVSIQDAVSGFLGNIGQAVLSQGL